MKIETREWITESRTGDGRRVEGERGKGRGRERIGCGVLGDEGRKAEERESARARGGSEGGRRGGRGRGEG